MALSKKKKKFLLYFSIVLILIFVSNFFISSEIESKQELTIDKNIESVWVVMGDEFDEVDKWSANFHTSKAGGSNKYPGLPYSKRITETERGKTVQELDAFDPAAHSLEYHITTGKPSIAAEARAKWSLVEDGSDKTNVILEFNMIAKGWLGLFMSGKIKSKIDASSLELAEELKYYMEKGTPHPRNLAASKNSIK
ncbi:MAG: hypothetical protein ACI865_001428 [Flavobacteriaceae bacterium]|jgi:hypothetical protein